jgi:phosphatidate phosphatase APP1
MPTEQASGQIRSDERVVFFPTAAHLNDQGDWIVPVHGWIYEPERDDVLRDAAVVSLRRLMGLDPSADEARVLSDRCRLFLVDNERGKQIDVRIGDQVLAIIKPSDPDGHFAGEVKLSRAVASQLARNNQLVYQAVTMPDDGRSFVGNALLVPPSGVSVISDIDDTIKVSEVTDRRALLVNTFLRDYRPVAGMAGVYRRWSDAGAVIHYVSSSPWQLYQPLDQFLREAGFPSATFHLKRFRLKDSSFWDLFAESLATKPPVIESLLQAFPQRRFLLIGDSGEQDPEVYGLIARRFPRQIIKVYIRDVTGERADSPRYEQAFHEVPAERWQIFTDPAVLMLPD